MARNFHSIGQMVRHAAAVAEEQAVSTGLGATMRRTFYTERYSPRQFSRDKPLDPGALWWQKNQYIEALYKRRDTLEKEFAWTQRNTFELVYFLGGGTALFYGLALFGIRSADRQSGYPERNFLGHYAPNSFVLPDEREFY
mmetsp:Transcript_43374/g.130069  ORF Transcript_43374/g.130069 Transcript_43374/m.130069 type:complete len:141 (-) Transcript_43374:341-763(-)|eukprot:366000-Chlamydomonas_euryale.AAC.26